MKKLIVVILAILSLPAFGLDKMCRNKTYIAEMDKFATTEGVQVGLIALPLLMPTGAIFDGDTYPDRYVIEFTPDPNIQQATFKVLITFDPNMCVDPPTRVWEASYPVVDTIPAPEPPVRPFAEKVSN